MTFRYVGHAEKWYELAIEGGIAGKDCFLRFRRDGRTLASAFRDIAALIVIVILMLLGRI